MRVGAQPYRQRKAYNIGNSSQRNKDNRGERCRSRWTILRTIPNYLPLVERVIAQTQARVFHSQNHFPEKILSLFEPHSVVIRKGKPHKSNEFGRLVRIAAADRGYWSAHNERLAAEMGVEQIVLPGQGPLSAERAVRQKKR